LRQGHKQTFKQIEKERREKKEKETKRERNNKTSRKDPRGCDGTLLGVRGRKRREVNMR